MCDGGGELYQSFDSTMLFSAQILHKFLKEKNNNPIIKIHNFSAVD